MRWSQGTKPDASIQDVQERIKGPGVTISDIRELVGDTDGTITQAKSHNAVGVRLCGWKSSQ